MIQNPAKRARLRSILITIILATLPCYLLGFIVLWIGKTVRTNFSSTPTITVEVIATEPPDWGGTPGIPVPSAQFPTATVTLTPTETLQPTVTPTYFIPSSTPTDTLEPTFTPTITETPITETLEPWTTEPTIP